MTKGKKVARLGAFIIVVCGIATLWLAAQIQDARQAYAQSGPFNKLASYPAYLGNTNRMTDNMHSVELGIVVGLILLAIGLVPEKG